MNTLEEFGNIKMKVSHIVGDEVVFGGSKDDISITASFKLNSNVKLQIDGECDWSFLAPSVSFYEIRKEGEIIEAYP